MAGGWFESVAEAERRAKRTLPPSVFKAIMAGAERGQTLRDNVAAFAELGLAPHVAGAPGSRDLSTTVMGVGHRSAGADVADRRAGGAPRRRGGGRPGRGGTRHRAGPERPGEHADRGRRGREPEDVRAAVLGRLAGVDRGAGRSRSGGRRGGADHHAGLDVHPFARLGQPVHPGPTRLQVDGEAGARGAATAAVGGPVGEGRAPAEARGAELRRRAGLLRRVRRVDGDAAADLGGPARGCAGCGTVRSWSRASCGSTTPAGRSRTSARPHFGVQPRRQQPRRHAGVDPRVAPRSSRPSATPPRS